MTIKVVFKKPEREFSFIPQKEWYTEEEAGYMAKCMLNIIHDYPQLTEEEKKNFLQKTEEEVN